MLTAKEVGICCIEGENTNTPGLLICTNNTFAQHDTSESATPVCSASRSTKYIIIYISTIACDETLPASKLTHGWSFESHWKSENGLFAIGICWSMQFEELPFFESADTRSPSSAWDMWESVESAEPPTSSGDRLASLLQSCTVGSVLVLHSISESTLRTGYFVNIQPQSPSFVGIDLPFWIPVNSSSDCILSWGAVASSLLSRLCWKIEPCEVNGLLSGTEGAEFADNFSVLCCVAKWIARPFLLAEAKLQRGQWTKFFFETTVLFLVAMVVGGW